MCGIAGFLGNGTEDNLWQMIKAINYRGPDYQGVSLTENLGFAHARLSIIDTDSRSHQPFFNPEKTLAIVFNGEIYNFLEIKNELLKTNKYTFRTSSDTEVLLYAYAEYGIECLQKIHGMFAFSIYDLVKKELFLAKDRIGKKPLYYTLQNNTFIFASEPKAILQHPSVKRDLNLEALNQYLTFDYVPTPNCIFEGIHKLEASHYLIVKNGAIQEKKSYWHTSFQPNNISYSDALNKFDMLLNEAVKTRMISDVPLGLFLSGGLDSSAVAYYAQKNSTQKVKTFSIGFNEKSYDESSYARLVAKQLGTEHHEQILSAKQSLDLLSVIVEKQDEPFADPSIIPTYFLSQFTKQHVTVALGGDGSDELMAGYPTFISDRVAPILHALPSFAISLFNKTSNFLPVSDKNISLDFKVKQFLKGFESKSNYTHSLWLGSFTPKSKLNLFTSDVKNKLHTSGLECIDKYRYEVSNENEFNKLLYTYFRTYLQDDILYKVDRASMYASLEVRAPFLDTNVINFLNSLPKNYKIKRNNGKRILKDLMRNKLPNEIIDRPKKGFGIPVSLWLRNELKNSVAELLSEKNIKQQGLFEWNYVDKLIKEHNSSKQNHRKLLWNLLIFSYWSKTYLN
ncbi:MAG: asparagine synthase (glutamine-hydrolyzing) [Bacteroidota bacterium]